MSTKIRHNTVVREKDQWFYGRVIRTLPDGYVLWLCCGLHFHINHVDELEADGYKGFMSNSEGRFIHMTTLRKLKQRATRYHGRNVWNTPLDYEFIRKSPNYGK